MAHDKRTHLIKKAAIVLTALAAFLLYMKENTVQFAAARAAEPGDHAALLAAIRLTPENAEHRFHLGESYLSTQDYAPAITHLRRAVELNPHRAKAWLALAHAYHFTGENELRRESLHRAVAAAPFDQRVAWDSANLYLATGDMDAAFKGFAHIVQGFPEARPEALKLCWRATRDVSRLVAELGIRKPDAFADLFGVLANEPAAAKQIYPLFLTSSRELHSEALNRYLGIAATGTAEDIESAWTQASRRFPELTSYRQPHNALGNGSFEQPLRFAMFDWQFTPNEATSLLSETADVKHGVHGLTLHLRRRPAGSLGLQQTALVKEGEWQLAGFVKTSGLDGVEMRVRDPKGNTLGKADISTGSAVWREHSFRLRVPAGVDRVVIDFAATSPTPQSGTLKLDGFTLRKVSP